jgi:hypothetical protein
VTLDPGAPAPAWAVSGTAAPPHLTAQPRPAILWGQATAIAPHQTRPMKILLPIAALAAVTLLAGAALSLSRETQARVADCIGAGRPVAECELVHYGR